MRLFIVGIGGCGGKVAEKFLGNQDVAMMGASLGDHISFGGIKGMWLEADVQETDNQKFFRPLGSFKRGYYPCYYIPHNALSSESRTSRLMQEKYGYDLKKQGFFRQAEFLKAIFDIFEADKEVQEAALKEYKFDNPILRSTWSNIRPFTTVAEAKESSSGSELCDGILFIVSHGGGTGTGFINPVTKYIRAERSAFPVFVLGVLTEEGTDKQQGAKEAKRNLGAIISIYDLLTKKKGQGVDGLILVDNQILLERFGGDYPTMDSFIYHSMKPFLAARHYPGEIPPSLAVREQFLEMLDYPPILVPCYGRHRGSEDSLVKNALKDGLLFGCDPSLADRAFVFVRGFVDSGRIRQAVEAETGLPVDKVSVWRKLGDDKGDEVLIMLRNPYGSAGAYNIKGTLENRIYSVTTSAINYIDEFRNEIIQPGRPRITNEAIEKYFYGQGGLKDKLQEAIARIESGQKPLFLEELKIFQSDGQRLHTVAQPLQTDVDDRIRVIIREEAERLLQERGIKT